MKKKLFILIALSSLIILLLTGLFFVFLPQNAHYFAVGVNCMPGVIISLPGEPIEVTGTRNETKESFLTQFRKKYFGTECVAW